MRTDEEIRKEARYWKIYDEYILEVLLDIRRLLANNQTNQ